jgi:hypothetical protein
MGFWGKLGRGLQRAAPIAVALTPTPFDDMALGIGSKLAEAKDKADVARIAIAALIRETNPEISDAALAILADELIRLAKRKVSDE